MWLRKMALLRSLEKEWLSPCLHPGSPRQLPHCHIRPQSEAKCTRWESKEASNKGGPSRRMGQGRGGARSKIWQVLCPGQDDRNWSSAWRSAVLVTACSPGMRAKA